MRIEIKNRHAGAVIYEADAHDLKTAVETAVKSYACLNNADLPNADLENANLERAILVGANLRGANLRGAHLQYSHFEGASLQGTDLEGARLEDTHLTCADLSGANFKDVCFHNASITGANLKGIKGYSEAFGVLTEIIRLQKPDTFSESEWSMIGYVTIRRLYWNGIKHYFGVGFLPVLEKLESVGYGEYAERYRGMLK